MFQKNIIAFYWLRLARHETEFMIHWKKTEELINMVSKILHASLNLVNFPVNIEFFPYAFTKGHLKVFMY